MVDSSVTPDATSLSRISFLSAGAVRRRPSPSSPIPSAVAAGTWWIPIIDHPGRPSYVRFARYPRKAKATYAEAVSYAARVIVWREHFAGFKRRRREAVSHPRYFLQAAE
jgi:hypothetical protein